MAERICTVDGCERPHEARGWCKPHYLRWYREQNGEQVRAGVRAAQARNGRVYRQRSAERRTAYARQWKQTNREKHAEHERVRRMRKRGNGQVKYDRRDIFERDNWTCGICRLPVQDIDSRLIDGPTIDHIIALADGGADEPGNVQLAHRRCNAGKRPVSFHSRRYGHAL